VAGFEDGSGLLKHSLFVLNRRMVVPRDELKAPEKNTHDRPRTVLQCVRNESCLHPRTYTK
jgi:hypothetical protein